MITTAFRQNVNSLEATGEMTMKIKVKREILLKGLQRVCNIIGSRTTIPVLANIVMEAKDGFIYMTTTDLELRISTKLPAEIETPGITTVPAKRLLGLVSKFKAEDVVMESNDSFNVKINCGTADFMLLGLDPKDFPEAVEFAPLRKFKLKQADFARLIDRISYAVSLDDSRKVLHGILVSVKEGVLTAVSTDGKRLALAEKLLDEPCEGTEGDVIITLKSATEAKRILEKEGEIFVEIGENLVSFKIGDTEIVSKLIEGNYPQYRAVIPQSFSKSVTIPCGDFSDALDIVSIPLSDSSSYVKLTFSENQLKFEANSINVGEGREIMPIEYGFEEVSVSFNPQFLADPFRHLDVENVTLNMNDSFSPIELVSGDGFIYIIMPMRKN
jgi:DNA polymerase-3 subunit beta